MNKNNLKELINLANHLDKIGERKIASKLDSVIKKASSSLSKIAEGSAFTVYVKNSDTGEEEFCCDIGTAKEVREALKNYVFDRVDHSNPEDPAKLILNSVENKEKDFDTIVILHNLGDHRTELSVSGLHQTIAGKSGTPGAEKVRKQREFADEEFAKKQIELANMPEEESLMPMPSDYEGFTGDLFFSEASKAEQRISKIASLLSGEFGGLDKKIRR